MLDRSIAEPGIYPAVDPPASTSRALTPEIVRQEHYDVARNVQKVLQRYKDPQDIIAILGMDEVMENNIRLPHLTIRANLVNEREVLIEVIDNGSGLKDTETIFDAFETTKEKGMGIGLAISRSIIEAHDGQLWAENNPDFGAKSALNFPSPVCGARRVLV